MNAFRWEGEGGGGGGGGAERGEKGKRIKQKFGK